MVLSIFLVWGGCVDNKNSTDLRFFPLIFLKKYVEYVVNNFVMKQLSGNYPFLGESKQYKSYNSMTSLKDFPNKIFCA